MNLYVLSRKSPGYGELASVVVKASDPTEARLLAISEYRHSTGVTDFADDENSTLVTISDDTFGVIATSFVAE